MSIHRRLSSVLPALIAMAGIVAPPPVAAQAFAVEFSLARVMFQPADAGAQARVVTLVGTVGRVLDCHKPALEHRGVDADRLCAGGGAFVTFTSRCWNDPGAEQGGAGGLTFPACEALTSAKLLRLHGDLGGGDPFLFAGRVEIVD